MEMVNTGSREQADIEAKVKASVDVRKNIKSMWD